MPLRQSNMRKVVKKRRWKRFVAGKCKSVKRGSQKLSKLETWERKHIVATRCFIGSGFCISVSYIIIVLVLFICRLKYVNSE